MPALPAAAKIAAAAGWLAEVSSVVIIETVVPFARIASSARGRSSATRSGRTWPFGRTVRSIPSNPMSIVAAARSVQLRSGRCLEKKQ